MVIPYIILWAHFPCKMILPFSFSSLRTKGSIQTVTISSINCYRSKTTTVVMPFRTRFAEVTEQGRPYLWQQPSAAGSCRSSPRPCDLGHSAPSSKALSPGHSPPQPRLRGAPSCCTRQKKPGKGQRHLVHVRWCISSSHLKQFYQVGQCLDWKETCTVRNQDLFKKKEKKREMREEEKSIYYQTSDHRPMVTFSLQSWKSGAKCSPSCKGLVGKTTLPFSRVLLKSSQLRPNIAIDLLSRTYPGNWLLPRQCCRFVIGSILV